MISSKKKVNVKTAKGYRLKNSTHKLIEKIQHIINGSKDTVVSRAVKLYYIQVNVHRKISVPVNKKLSKK